MSFHSVGGGMSDYAPVSYSGGRLYFRGPAPDHNRPFAAFIGGSDTFGAGVPDPFPDRVARALGVQCLNLGVNQAGPDVLQQERSILAMAQKAVQVVVQAPSVRNLTTDFVQVHPRRNDRIIHIKPALLKMTPGQNWINVHFTGHLDQVLAANFPDAFHTVLQARSETWLVRMQGILSRLPETTLVVAGPSEIELASYLDASVVQSLPRAGQDPQQAYTDAILGGLK